MKTQEKRQYEFRIFRQFKVQTGNEIIVEAESKQEAMQIAMEIAEEENSFPEIIPDSNARYIVDIELDESSVEEIDEEGV